MAVHISDGLSKHDKTILEILRDDETGRDGGAEKEANGLARLDALNNPAHPDFEPTVMTSLDVSDLEKRFPLLNRWIVQPYAAWARKVVRHEADVVMVTQTLVVLCTVLPSAILLLRRFTWTHAVLHLVYVVWLAGLFSVSTHQHMHQGGLFARRGPYAVLDDVWIYLLGPLMGQGWNAFYYHHKMHHREGNGPDDLSSTLRYQRDRPAHFALYFARFLLLISVELPVYYLRRGRYRTALKGCFWDWAWHGLLVGSTLRWGAGGVFAFVLPHVVVRLGLMIANWGQHAFIDRANPDADLSSSITLVGDAASNRHCLHDGYHTTHHLHPRRHWRDLPAAFARRRADYAAEGALVLQGIDYVVLALRLFRGDYESIARCVVPMGAKQEAMTMAERVDMLRELTRPFEWEEIEEKYPKWAEREGRGKWAGEKGMGVKNGIAIGNGEKGDKGACMKSRVVKT